MKSNSPALLVQQLSSITSAPGPRFNVIWFSMYSVLHAKRFADKTTSIPGGPSPCVPVTFVVGAYFSSQSCGHPPPTYRLFSVSFLYMLDVGSCTHLTPSH
jgi:hypothetical protein